MLETVRAHGWRPGWDGHLLLFYDQEAQRRAGVAAWVGRGLDLGSKIIYTEPDDAPADRSLRGMLEGEPHALEALDRGQIQVVPAERTSYELSFMETVVDEALSEGYPSVRWSADASAAWQVMPRRRHEQLEQATDRLCLSRPLSAMCQYRTPESGEAAWSLSRSHRAGLREQLFQAATVDGGLALAGELDIASQDTLRSLLATATTGLGQDPFVLDLSWVDFLDLPGARALMLGTGAHRDRGGQVLLQAPRPHVEHLIHLLGIDQKVGIQLGGRPR